MILVVIYLLIILIVAIVKKVNIMESFIVGVKGSYQTLKNLFPSLMFFLLGVNVFLNSGVIELFEAFCERSNLISEVIIQFILRPISNSSSLIMMTKVFDKYGVDSLVGKMSSILQASTDTSLYIIVVYFSTIGIKKIGKPLLIAIITNVITMIFCLIITYLIYTYFK